jgi:hypothetical protein
MKSALFSAAFLALAAVAATDAQANALALPGAVPPTDTIVVRLPNQAVMTLVVRDAAQLRQLPQYHLDSLVARLGGYIKRADEAAKVANTDRLTTSFYPNKDQPGQNLPEEIRITTRKPVAGDGYGPSNKVEVLLEKRFGVVINTDRKTNDQPRAAASRPDRQAYRDSMREARWDHKSSSTDAIFDLGLNALINRSGANQPELRTLGSRYVNLGFNYKQRLGGRRSPLYLVVGPEFSFNNYMLEGNNKWVSVPGALNTNITAVVPESNGRQYQKTKLATSTITIPLMLQLNTHGNMHFRLGAGGFVGYRLASWTKLKYFENGSTYKDKDYGSYNLNDWQYGLQGIIGVKSLTLFAKYNLNTLFRDGQGPQAQTLSFGVRFLTN